MNAGLLIIILLLALAIFGFPIYIALGIGTVVALNMAELPIMSLPQKLFTGMDSTSLLAIPFFILAGNLMSRSITNKLINLANAFIGFIKGSLGVITVLTSALFGAISGSGVATASAIGGITIPGMKDEGYPDHFAGAVAAISSILGPIIPPSIVLIVYSSITNVSVKGLFMGSVVPGLVMVLGLSIYVLFYGKKNNLPSHEKVDGKGKLKATKDGIWALLMPVIILGGIFGGIFTATEAAVVACVYAILVGLFIYRDTKLKELPGIFVTSSISTATIMVMVGISKASSYVIVTSGLPQEMLNLFTSITESKIVILLLLNILFLIIGMIMEANAAVVMMVPILMPLLTAFQIDPLAFGVIISFNLCIGLVTPPVGLCLLISNQIADTSLSKTFKTMLPMLIIAVIVLLLITYIEPLTTWLPSMLSM